METKQCSLCGEQKPLSVEFYPRRKPSKDGFRNQCKTCCNSNARKYSKHALATETPEKRRLRLEKETLKREKYCERRKKNRKDWSEKNKKHCLDYNREFLSVSENRDRMNKRRRERRKSDPIYHLSDAVRSSIRYGLHYHDGHKGTSKTWVALPYTPEELKEHLERQFDERMNWENYGTYWHIDHIYPQSLLPYDTLEHPNFQKCWALENLRPLEAIENIRKSNKILSEE